MIDFISEISNQITELEVQTSKISFENVLADVDYSQTPFNMVSINK